MRLPISVHFVRRLHGLWLKELYLLRGSPHRVFAFVDCAPDCNHFAGLEQTRDRDVGLVPKHDLERAGQILDKDDPKRFAFLLRELAIDLRDRARDGESGSIVQFA